MSDEKRFSVRAEEYLKLIEFVADFAGEGLRCDMNPTMCLPDTPEGMDAVSFLLAYFGRNVKRKQEEAFEVLGFEMGPLGFRWVHGFVRGIREYRSFSETNGLIPQRIPSFMTDEERKGYDDGVALAKEVYDA